MTDLFGVEIVEPWLAPIGAFKRKEIPKGYAAQPGSGPDGETCRTCKHYVSLRYHDKTYPKCKLRAKLVGRGEGGSIHLSWSHCYASDIRAKSPACKHWTIPDPIEWQKT